MERGKRFSERELFVVRDGLFSSHLINAANSEWPASDWQHWLAYGYGSAPDAAKDAKKLATKDESRITPACRMLLFQMAQINLPVIDDNTFPDLGLYGAGMHEIPDGGHLSRHLDSDSYSQRPTWRRAASGVLYLNDDFDGGVFSLEMPDGAVQKIHPKKNRLVVFRSVETAFHWVDKVKDGSRRTLAMFWWRLSDSVTKRSRAVFKDKHEN